MNHDVFISFSFQDQEQAEKIVNILSSEYGITCWICTRDIDGGKNFKTLITKAIEATKVVVFIQSENSLSSKDIPREIGIALDESKTIIPFKLDKSQPHGALRYDLHGVEFIDATIPTFEERVSELAKSIFRAIGKNKEKNKASANTYKLQSGRVICSEIFYGRDDIINEIHKSFESRNVVFLRGMGGIGKSEIARQYAHKYSKDYDTVVFARYETDLEALIADDTVFSIDGLIRKQQEDGTLQDDREYAEIKLNVIKSISDESTLIIIDNFDVTSDPLLKDFTDNIKHHVLITSRCEPERVKYHVIPVAELDDETLRDMVVDFANPNTSMIDRDDPAFPELFELTNRHTLTLELIAKYMDEKCIDDVSEMTAIIREQKLAALSDADEDRYASIRNLFRITDLSDREKTFLRCLALMPPSGVGQKNFRNWCGEVYTARTRLAGLSLIKLDNSTKSLSLHPIIRQIVLTDLKPDYRNCKEFLDEFADGIGEGKSWNWSADEKRAVTNCCDEIISSVNELNDETFDLFFAISILKNFVQEYDQVMPFHRRLFEYACTRYGDKSLKAGLVAFRAGWYCKKLLLLDESAVWLEERAYPILKENASKAIKEYPHCCTNLATLYIKKYELTGEPENLTTAERYIDEADVVTCANYKSVSMGNDARIIKTMHIRIAGVRMEQADINMKQGEYGEAQKALEEAKEIITVYPDNGADLAYLTSKFAEMYYLKGEYANAVSALNLTNDMYDKVFSTENESSLNVFIMLGECCEKMNDTENAFKSWQKAYEIAEGILVPEHRTMKKINSHLSMK